MKKLKIAMIVVAITVPVMLLGGAALWAFNELLDMPDRITKTWQTVTVEKVGSFKVPAEWCVERQGNVIYITDKPRDEADSRLYIVGMVSPASYRALLKELCEIVEGDVKYSIGNRMYANSVDVSLREYRINGYPGKHYLITCPDSELRSWVRLMVWDMETVTPYIVSQIAKTFTWGAEAGTGSVEDVRGVEAAAGVIETATEAGVSDILGAWRIARVAGVSRVSVLTNYDDYIGVLIEYGAQTAVYDGEWFDGILYRVARGNDADEFFVTSGYASAEDLGIVGAEVCEIHCGYTFGEDDDGRVWVLDSPLGLGSNILVKDANTIVIGWDGVCFEAVRL